MTCLKVAKPLVRQASSDLGDVLPVTRIAPSLLIVCTMLLCSGCVRRRLTVRSNPPGASVYVDKQYIGETPISTNLTYYGTREIEITADGYRSERVLRSLTPPWYQIPPLDFVSETLWPFEIRDERVLDFELVPAQYESMEAIRAKGNDLRLQASQAIAVAPPPTQSPGSFNGAVAPAAPDYVPLQPAQVVPPGLAPQPTVVSPSGPQPSFFQPNGLPPTRIPETGILPGGGYRPPIDDPERN